MNPDAVNFMVSHEMQNISLYTKVQKVSSIALEVRLQDDLGNSTFSIVA